MENVCHTLFGGVLARAGLDRLSPLATPTAIVAANFPDVDVVTLFGNNLWYLEHHRGITHSALGILVQAPIVAAGALAVDVAWRRRRDPGAPKAKFWALTLVALAGLASHLVLDWTNSYGVKPWLPFDATWYYGDIVFVVDPWLWLLLGGALFLGSRASRVIDAAWITGFALLGAAVLAAGLGGMRGAIGLTPVAVWLAGLASLLVLRWRWRDAPACPLALGSLAATVVFWLSLALVHSLALRPVAARAAEVPGTRVLDYAAVPMPMRPDFWRALVATDTHLETGDVTIVDLEERYVARQLVERNLDDPAVRAALATCPGQVALAFNRFLYADLESGEEGGATVLLKDARFGDLGSRGGFATTVVEIGADLVPAPDGRRCPPVGWNGR